MRGSQIVVIAKLSLLCVTGVLLCGCPLTEDYNRDYGITGDLDNKAVVVGVKWTPSEPGKGRASFSAGISGGAATWESLGIRKSSGLSPVFREK